MSDISKIKVSSVEYDIKDIQARKDLGNLGTRVTELEQHGGGGSVPKPLTYDYMPVGYPKKSVQPTTLMAEQEVAFALGSGVYTAQITTPFEIVEGQTYTVNWDGTEYECVGAVFSSAPILGNLSILGEGNDTGEPFICGYNMGQALNVFYTLDTSASHTISVKTPGEVITPMAEEFLPSKAIVAINNAQTAAENAQTAAENAQTAANSNKAVLDAAFSSSVVTFTFDKQTANRPVFMFNSFNYYKISDFNPSPSDVISFKGTKESGEEFSDITIGNNCVLYGPFIVVASAGDCSVPITETVTFSFTATSAGLYAQHMAANTSATAGTAEFVMRWPGEIFIGSSTEGSTKKFKITVDDSGTISATEVT